LKYLPKRYGFDSYHEIRYASEKYQDDGRPIAVFTVPKSFSNSHHNMMCDGIDADDREGDADVFEDAQ
jgi:hypothetical protein